MSAEPVADALRNRDEREEGERRFAAQLRELGVIGAFTTNASAGSDGGGGADGGDGMSFGLVTPLAPVPHWRQHLQRARAAPTTPGSSAAQHQRPADDENGGDLLLPNGKSANAANTTAEIVRQNARLADRVRQLEGALAAAKEGHRRAAAQTNREAQAQADQCRALEDAYQRGLNAAEARVRDAENHIVSRVQQATTKHIETTAALERGLAALRREKEIESETMHVAFGKLQAELAISERDRDTAVAAAEEARLVMEEAEVRWDSERLLLQVDRKAWRDREAQLMAQLKAAQDFGDAVAGAFGTAEVESAALANEATRVLFEMNGGHWSNRGKNSDDSNDTDASSTRTGARARTSAETNSKTSPGSSNQNDSDMAVALAIAGVAAIPDPREVTIELLRQKLVTAETTMEAQAKRWARRERTLLDSIARKEIPSFIHFRPRRESDSALEMAASTRPSEDKDGEASGSGVGVVSVAETQTSKVMDDRPRSRSQSRSHERKKMLKKAKHGRSRKERTGDKINYSRRDLSEGESSEGALSAASSSYSSSSPSTHISTYSSIAEVHSDEDSGAGSSRWNLESDWSDNTSMKISRTNPITSRRPKPRTTKASLSRGNGGTTKGRRKRATSARRTMPSRNTTTQHEDGKRAIAISSDQSTAKGTQIYDGRSFGDSQGTRASKDMWEGSRLYLGSPGQTRRLRRIYSERANSKMKKKKKKKNHSSDRSLSPTREYYDRVPTLETLSMEASRSKDGKRWVSGVRRTSKNEGRGSRRKKLS